MAARSVELLSQQSLRVLADAGSRLAESIDVETTLTTVASLLLPSLADGCVIDVVEADGALRRIAAAHVDPAKQPIAARLKDLPPPGPNDAIHRVLESTEPSVILDADEESLRKVARSPEHFALLKALEIRSGIIAPLRSRGVAIGIVWLFSSGSPRPYSTEEVLLLRELASRAATSIENARLFRQLAHAIAQRDDFLSVASHELNTPLATLRLIVDSLKRAKHDDAVAARLRTVDRQVSRLTSLVAQLLDVSRLGAGRMTIEPSEMDLVALVHEVVATLAPPGSVRVEARGGPVTGTWDRNAIEQVLVNLISNAQKYGGDLPIDVTVAASDDGEEALLTVRDYGLGIAPADRERVFERFERAVSSRHFSGLGLGLWISREIVDMHGGRIDLESEVGHGSTFRVHLPRRPPPPSK